MSAEVVGHAGKKLSFKDLFLGTIVLILFLDTVSTSSAMGQTSIAWYVILVIIFLIPMGLITAELSSTYPSDGGLYHWIKISLGDDWAARTSWYYWLNIAIWMGSSTCFVMDVFNKILLVTTGIEVSFPVYLGASIALVWVYAFFAMRPLNQATTVTNIGGAFKLIIVGSLIVCAICFLVFNGGQTANDLSPAALVPAPGAIFAFFPALIYNLLGLDAIAAIGGSNIENPKKDLPRNIIISCIVLAFALIVANFCLLAITPLDDIDIINAIPACFTLTFEGPLGIVLYVVVAIMFIVTLVFPGPTWMEAGAKMSIEAAKNNELPKIFASTNKHGSPSWSILLMAIVGSALLIIYGILTTVTDGAADDLFWQLFSFVTVIFTIPYILMPSAFIWLRKHDKTERAYRFPGPQAVPFFFCRLSQALLIFTLIRFFWVPGEEVSIVSDVALGIGVVIGIGLGEVFNVRRKKILKAQAQSEAAEGDDSQQ